MYIISHPLHLLQLQKTF